MYEFPLSLSQKKLINEWTTKKNKPLFITGNSGSGKTTFANQLLNDYHIIHINSEHLKYSGDLIDYIKNSLFKMDILIMCSKHKYKALLIDDIHLFVKYSKSIAFVEISI